MGIPFSCPFPDLDDLDRRLEAFLVRSMSFDGRAVRTALRSVSFDDRDSEHATVRSFGSGNTKFQGSVSFTGRQLGTRISFGAHSDKEENVFVKPANPMSIGKGENEPTDSSHGKTLKKSAIESGDTRYLAALRLQKVYKSFRTRRKLADCAVLVEQRWWKVLDYAQLKRSSISFFDIEKPETAVSRWSRARTRAAKVGKGLSKDERALKLALQHWLEAIDPRHRYGHNLQFYYAEWLHCDSRQPFFYWLDIGEGKEANHERCPRSKLRQQCIKYLGPTERKAYEVTLEDGKLFYKQTGKLLDTRGGPEDTKWIFVLSTSKTLYVGQKCKGKFQHSSFLAGGATLSAGRLMVEDGILKAVWPHSGHYLPTMENFEEFMLFLKEHNVDLSIVQKNPVEDELHLRKKSGIAMQNNFEDPECALSNAQGSGQNRYGARWYGLSRRLDSKIATLEIPGKDNVIEMLRKYEQEDKASDIIDSVGSPMDGYETAEESLSDDDEFTVSKRNLFDEDEEMYYEEPIPKEKIIQRINSHKRTKSYQLAQCLSCKWTTGAGPRIGCVRDYPSELQNRALEEVNLSPRSAFSSPRKSFRLTPTNLSRERTAAGRSPLGAEQMARHQI
ncbi:IQ domain-containing protein IQM6 [Diospyros lotus]|uniref:IQ domain-containing protein IQM6 n=1 Tax=Diospyros lotus TaxID=55363 RepID=UPI002257D7FC|nr:IQ domain-containing protein IQM6 [Diospyros lotus]